MASIDRELNADYFGIKIRKIEPVIKPVIKPVEGFKVKVSFFLGHPVKPHKTENTYTTAG